jgi:hypothetical protein
MTQDLALKLQAILENSKMDFREKIDAVALLLQDGAGMSDVTRNPVLSATYTYNSKTQSIDTDLGNDTNVQCNWIIPFECSSDARFTTTPKTIVVHGNKVSKGWLELQEFFRKIGVTIDHPYYATFKKLTENELIVIDDWRFVPPFSVAEKTSIDRLIQLGAPIQGLPESLKPSAPESSNPPSFRM